MLIMVVSVDLPDILYQNAVKSGDVSLYILKWVKIGLDMTEKRKLGGSSKSEAKKAACRANGLAPVKPGSRPRGRPITNDNPSAAALYRREYRKRKKQEAADQSGLPADQSGLAIPAAEADNISHG
jgi:hypothetical protein